MKRYVLRSVVAVALVAMTGTAWAQPGSMPYPGRVEGKVVDVNRTWLTVTMDDGTVLNATSLQQIAGLAAGEPVTATFVAEGDRNEITNITPLGN